MASNTLHLVHPRSDRLRDAPVGFSWTLLFFGIFVPMIRGDWKWFFILLVVALLTLGLSWFVFPFFYNKIYVKNLVQDGYVVKSVDHGSIDEVSSKLGLRLPSIADRSVSGEATPAT